MVDGLKCDIMESDRPPCNEHLSWNVDWGLVNKCNGLESILLPWFNEGVCIRLAADKHRDKARRGWESDDYPMPAHSPSTSSLPNYELPIVYCLCNSLNGLAVSHHYNSNLDHNNYHMHQNIIDVHTVKEMTISYQEWIRIFTCKNDVPCLSLLHVA